MKDTFVGNRIYEIRTAKGISQENLALGANITRKALWSIENNLSDPRVGTLKKLCDVLNVGLIEFFDSSLVFEKK